MAKVSGVAHTEIDAPLDLVWGIVQDVERWSEWQATLGDVRPHDHDEHGRLAGAEVAFDAKVVRIRLELRFAYEPPLRQTFTRHRGDLTAMDGSWQLEDLGDGRTRATYALEAEAGGMLGMFVTGEVQSKLREILVNVRPAELKARAETAHAAAPSVDGPS